MNHESCIHDEHDDSHVTADQIVSELEGVIGDVHSFLSDFCARFDQEITERSLAEQQNGSQQSKIQSEQLRKSWAEFESERELWEASRNREEIRIAQRVEQLSAAWLKLEDEQRSFLQLNRGQPVTETPNQTNPANADVTSESTTNVAIDAAPDGEHSRTSAIRQFQRLRREIQSSRPQTGGT